MVDHWPNALFDQAVAPEWVALATGGAEPLQATGSEEVGTAGHAIPVGYRGLSDWLEIDGLGAAAAAASGEIVLTAKDVMALELGPLSDLDARFVQWLAEKTEVAAGRRVVVRRSWKDLIAAIFGFV